MYLLLINTEETSTKLVIIPTKEPATYPILDNVLTMFLGLDTSITLFFSFFKDVTKGSYYKNTDKFILSSKDKDMYTKWSCFMNDRYFEIVSQLKKGNK